MNWRRIVWLLRMVALPTLAEGDRYELVLRGSQHDQLYRCRHQAWPKSQHYLTRCTAPFGS
ncbi:hypothetical protein ACVXG9_24185 [Escherichia coli]